LKERKAFKGKTRKNTFHENEQPADEAKWYFKYHPSKGLVQTKVRAKRKEDRCDSMKVQSDGISTWVHNSRRTPEGMRGILYSC